VEAEAPPEAGAASQQEPEPAPQPEAPPIDTETPRVGPKIVGMAEEKPPPVAVIKRLQDPRRPRRKRPNAAEKHRRAFFARLNELRGSRSAPPKQEARPAEEAPPKEEPQAEATETEAVEAAMPVEAGSVPEETPAEQPDAEQPAVEEQPAVGEQPAAEEPQAEQPAPEEPISEETPARRQARLAAAIERVGGPETVRQALQPKRDDDGQPKKWAVVCCDASLGLKPGDPTFNAWVRLAATPVREIKGLVRPDEGERGGGRRGGPGRGRGPRREGAESGGGRGGGRRQGGDRGPRRERVSREDLEGAQDGTFKPTIRIIGLDDQDEDRKERERRRKEEREAKRKAERERLERLGY
jgi:hypothetical protein